MVRDIFSSDLKHMFKRVEDGYVPASEAIDMAVAAGFVAVGTAITAEYHVPVPQWTASDPVIDASDGSWYPRIPKEDGGSDSVLRASRVSKTAIWTAFGGDPNVHQQRMTLGGAFAFTPEGQFYKSGTFGWNYDPQTSMYVPHWHRDLANAVREFPDEKIIGHIDFCKDDGSFTIEVPGEPGHVGSPLPHKTRMTLPARMGDVRSVAAGGVLPFYYKPLTR